LIFSKTGCTSDWICGEQDRREEEVERESIEGKTDREQEVIGETVGVSVGGGQKTSKEAADEARGVRFGEEAAVDEARGVSFGEEAERSREDFSYSTSTHSYFSLSC
jgi:sugar phosphate isomerase/epimerase